MSQNFFIFLFFYFFIIFAVTGIGLAAGNILKINNEYAEINDNFGYTGLVGIFLLIIYSYLSHFFFKHNFTHNILILSIGFFYFIYSFVKIENKK
jgi:ABC-type Fe3+-siderophore transport system permease subunit